MGKKLDALLGRSFKAYKLRALVNLSLSRLAILKNQRQARCSLARSDVTELLNLGYHERALHRVEQVIKEQNILDVLAMIEGYCSHVIERITLIQEEKECPDELKEAVSSLTYASSRTGDFPELKQMRAVFTARFGKEFTARSVELRNNCSVSITMIQKLSTRQPSLETRIGALKEIAAQDGIELRLEHYDIDSSTAAFKGKTEKTKYTDGATENKQAYLSPKSDIEADFATSMGDKSRKKIYTDVADAAEAAFQSAAYAAAAAKAAVELSRFGRPTTGDPHTDHDDDGNDDHNHNTQRTTAENVHEIADDHRRKNENPPDMSSHEENLHYSKVEGPTINNETELGRDEGSKQRKRPKSVRSKRREHKSIKQKDHSDE